jgi:hypothetical protein
MSQPVHSKADRMLSFVERGRLGVQISLSLTTFNILDTLLRYLIHRLQVD